VAFISFIYGQQDQTVNELQNRDEIVQNWLGKWLSAHILIYKGFGCSGGIFLTGLFNTQFLLEN
jgi:hypothetical protein